MKLSQQNSLILLGPVLVAAAIGIGLHQLHPFESPPDQAYRLCGECGIELGEVGTFVETMRRSTLTREEELERFRELFKRREDAKPCEPCDEAVLDAAGK